MTYLVVLLMHCLVLTPACPPARHLSLLLQGSLAYLFVLTANDKQWGAAESKLRVMLETFKA